MSTPFNPGEEFCKQCGLQLTPRDVRCPRCNTAREAAPASSNYASTPSSPYSSTPSPPYSSAAPTPSKYNVNPWQQPERVVTIGEWMLMILVLCIPLVNIIMMFVWAFGNDGSQTKSNYFKAVLIWTGIFTVLYILFLVIFGAAMMSSFGNMGNM